jgi:hypothetical protein
MDGAAVLVAPFCKHEAVLRVELREMEGAIASGRVLWDVRGRSTTDSLPLDGTTPAGFEVRVQFVALAPDIERAVTVHFDDGSSRTARFVPDDLRPERYLTSGKSRSSEEFLGWARQPCP